MSAPPSSSESVRFLLDGEVLSVSGQPPTMTVLEHLRKIRGRTGTKEGCAEGDCGACTVVLGELTPGAQEVRYRAINSCIRFLPTIDGKELITVESLQASDGSLHPVQQAMVDEHASQCGFCTPGFVMSLLAMYLERDAPATREQIVSGLSGNLCRCTGYRPIIDAGCRMWHYPEPQRWSRPDAHSGQRARNLRSLQRSAAEGPLRFAGYCAPRSLPELCAELEAAPDSLVLAGGTDVGLWVTKHLRELAPILYIGEVAELGQVRRSDSELWIGAGVSLSDAWPALLVDYPELAEQARRFASPPVCNSGTLCGNIANGSPIGDSLPALLALGAEVEICSSRGRRRQPLDRFYLGYRKKDLASGELVTAVVVPRRKTEVRLASYKVAKRFDQDISAVCATFAVEVTDGRVGNARLAFGGLASTARRATHAEAAFNGQPWSDAAICAAGTALAADFQPISDMRASDAYRLQVARNLLRRFYLEHSPAAGQLRLTGAGAAIP
jgi:xanthine dehydrogenase small subunit